MPQLVAAVAAYSAGTLTVIQVIGAVIETALFINGLEQSRRARKAARAAASQQELQTRTFRSSDAPQVMIYGTARVGGLIAYAVRHPVANQEVQTVVIALAGHECEAIDDIWFNDESIGALDANGWVTTGKYFIDRTYSTAEEYPYPGAGESITLDNSPSAITSVVYTMPGDFGGDQRILQVGVDYTVSGSTLTFIPDLLLSYPVTINYQHRYTKPLVRAKKFLGVSAGERDTDLETNSGGEWTSVHVGKGICRIHVTIDFDQNVFGQVGVPNITAIVRGKKVRNWSSGASSFSNNAARCQLDYLTDPLGFGVPIARVNSTAAQAAQSADAEAVATDGSGGTQSRYTVDGVISTEASRRENMEMLLSANAGTLLASGGQWYLKSGVYSSPVFTLDESDLAGEAITIQPAMSRHDTYNSVRGRFVDPSARYLPNSFPPYQSATYVAQDNNEALFADVNLPLTTDVLRAQRIAKLMLHRARQALVFTADWKLSAYALQPGDSVRVKLARYGWDAIDSGQGKVFRVQKRTLTIGESASIRLVMQEEANAVYSWAYNEATDPDPAPNTALPDPGVVQALAAFTVASDADSFDVLSDGTIQPYALASWTAVTGINVIEGGKVALWWRRANSMVYNKLSILPGDTTVKLRGVARGELLEVKARCETASGATGPYAYATHTISPDIPTNLTEVPQSGNMLRNAGFETGTQGWTVTSSAGSAATFVRNDAGPIPGAPTNALITQPTSSSSDVITAQSGRMAVKAGEDYVAFVGLAPLRSTARLVLGFFTAAGAALATHQSAYVAAHASAPAQESDYTIADVFATAPSGAAYAQWSIEKTGTASGSNSTCDVFKPYCGISTASIRPVWSAGLPPEPTQATNHLENSSFAYGVEGWTTDTGGGHSGTVTFAKEGTYPVAGFPTSARLASTSTQVATGAYLLATAADVAVSPGSWWGVACKAIPVGARFTVDVLWFDAAGSLISSQACSSLAPMTAPAAAPAPSAFGVSRGVFIAPTNARRLRARLDLYDFSAAAPYVHMLQPIVAPVPVGAADVPAWTPGPIGRVSTLQIMNGAVAPHVEATASSITVPSTSSGSTPQLSATLSTPLEVGTPLIVTLSGVVSVASSSNYAIGKFGGPIVNSGSVTRPATSYVHLLDGADGVTAGKQFFYTFRTTSGAKGSSTTFDFYCAAGGGGGTVTLTDVKLRVEARKD